MGKASERPGASVRFGEVPLMLTAPHTIYLLRDGHKVHKPEDHTGYRCEVLADHLNKYVIISTNM